MKAQNEFIGDSVIYTSAQNDSQKKGKSAVLLKGKGSDLSDKKLVEGKAKRKLISQSVVHKLIEIAEERGDIENLHSLWNMYHCNKTLYKHEGRSYGDFCKNHICTLCSANKKARMIEQYLPIVKSWKEPYFLTLTSKAVTATHLKRNVEGTFRAITKIIKNQRQKAYRYKGKAFVGIRAIECNFNPLKRTYNPHVHLLLPDKETAEAIRKEWLRLWTKEYTSVKAQYLRKVTDTEKDLIEIIKYGSKVLTDPDMKKGKKRTSPPKVYIRALYNVFDVFKGRRLIQNFGFNVPKVHGFEEEPIVSYTAEKFTYLMSERAWISNETEKPLFEAIIDPKIDYLIENDLDLNLD